MPCLVPCPVQGAVAGVVQGAAQDGAVAGAGYGTEHKVLLMVGCNVPHTVGAMCTSRHIT